MMARWVTYFKGMPDSRKQLIKFVMIGVFAVLVDMTTYFILLRILPETMFGVIENEAMGKTLSFLTGTFVTYNLNKYWTWKQRNKSKTRVLKFSLVYGFSLGMNVLTNIGVLSMLNSFREVYDIRGKYLIAFVCATGISAVINFAGQKLWVFGRKEH